MIVYRELSSLELDLGFSAKTLYAVSHSINKHYRTTTIPKRNGGFRKLSVPDDILKLIQKSITEKLILPVGISKYAKAYYPSCSISKNAKPHINKKIVLNLDIFKFFDSISYITVKDKVFPSIVYAEPLRILLAILCYYHNGLPQGAPSSPAISNVIMYEFDELVGKWCESQGIAYTRYCDDMTFSGDFNPSTVISFVRSELKKQGFLLNEQKTKIQRDGKRKSVTGVVVNEKLSVPVEYRRRLRQELYYIGKFGVQEHIKKANIEISPNEYIQHLLGQINYVLGINPKDEYFLRRQDSLKSTLTKMLLQGQAQ